jgi:hypothetical protein
MTEEILSGKETATTEALVLPEKCTRQNVQTVVLKPKCLSNLTQKDLFTAENVFLNIGNPEKTADTKYPQRNNLGVFYTVLMFFRKQAH